MKLLVQGSTLQGASEIPGSKSHTIRAVALASLAQGESILRRPLVSADTRAAVMAYRSLGTKIVMRKDDTWVVQGKGGAFSAPADYIDVKNSGTTMRIAMGSAALLKEGQAFLTGDQQVRRRPCGPLAQSLNDLGARVSSSRNNDCPPFVVGGPIRGGETTLEAVTSQYVTSLLMNTPLAEGDTTLHVPLLNEKPYVGITLDWLERLGVVVEHEDDLSEFYVRGGQQYKAFERQIPADFSSASFFLAAGALNDNEILSKGLDVTDTQGDKAVMGYLEQMGAQVTVEEEGVRVKAQTLKGCEIDMNATPDALPIMAVLGCFARGTTRLVNVAQARMKETDRITVMAQELGKLGAKISELPDGLVIEESALQAGEVEGHDDHRVVMAMAIAGTMLAGTTVINGYEAVNITFPTFLESLVGLGGKAHVPNPRRRQSEQ
jgi:3-phosphoshikimate 1-carboxyvinyltransferase